MSERAGQQFEESLIYVVARGIRLHFFSAGEENNLM